MKFKGQFIVKKIGATHYAVPTGKTAAEMKCMIKLNDTAAFLWERAAGGADEAELAKILADTFSLDEATAKTDVDDFITTLKGASIIE